MIAYRHTQRRILACHHLTPLLIWNTKSSLKVDVKDLFLCVFAFMCLLNSGQFGCSTSLPLLHPACRRLDGMKFTSCFLRKPSLADLFSALILRNKTYLPLLVMNWIWELDWTVLTRHFMAVLCLQPLRTMVVFVGGSIWCFSTSTTLEMSIHSVTGSRKYIKSSVTDQ